MIRLIALIFLCFVTIIGCKNALIEGKVIDNFGNPVEDANVSIVGSTFHAITDNKGKYSIDYIPGNLKVKVEKLNYIDTTFELSLAKESIYPAADVILIKIPEKMGIFFINNHEYIAISKTNVSSIETNLGDGWFVREKNEFFINYDRSKILKIKNNLPLIFFDADSENQILFKTTKLEDDKLVFFTRILNNGWMGFQMGDFKDSSIIINEKFKKLKNNYYIRSIDSNRLSPGIYIFSSFDKNRKMPFNAIIYYFEVI